MPDDYTPPPDLAEWKKAHAPDRRPSADHSPAPRPARRPRRTVIVAAALTLAVVAAGTVALLNSRTDDEPAAAPTPTAAPTVDPNGNPLTPATIGNTIATLTVDDTTVTVPATAPAAGECGHDDTVEQATALVADGIAAPAGTAGDTQLTLPDGRDYALTIIQLGLARPAPTDTTSDGYASQLDDFATTAEADDIGLWATCWD